METQFIDVAGRRIAYLKREGSQPTLVWLGGFRSEMTATKASHLDGWAARTGRAYVRFDYSGHGQSSGGFADGTISAWLEDSLAVLKECTTGPLLLVGSSMGGWLALLAAKALRDADDRKVIGLLLIAPAPDFTERLIWRRLPASLKEEISREGVWHRPSEYSPEPTPITRALIEDGRRHLLLDRPLDLSLPVHILHGTADPDVPVDLSMELMGQLAAANVTLTLIKDGDHRLSAPADLALLTGTLDQMMDASQIHGRRQDRR